MRILAIVLISLSLFAFSACTDEKKSGKTHEELGDVKSRTEEEKAAQKKELEVLTQELIPVRPGQTDEEAKAEFDAWKARKAREAEQEQRRTENQSQSSPSSPQTGSSPQSDAKN